MPVITIDGRRAEVAPGATLLAAARQLGLTIPTLCHREGCAAFTSCMVCVVADRRTGALIPSCAAPARDGMDIDASGDAVRAARRSALELLLSEHVGDCEGPCRLTCPADMRIPLMLRQIAAGRLAEALVTVKEHIALPAVLGRICPAPCEKGCRRALADGAVSICLLKRFVADVDLALPSPYRPACPAPSGRRVALCGAGPTGLSAAYYLRRLGHACTLFEAAEAPGGALRTAVPRARLPLPVLDAEIGQILRLGVEIRPSLRVADAAALAALRAGHDAVVVATGPVADGGSFGLPCGERGIRVDHLTFETGMPGVFAGGAAIHPTRMAVRAAADGRALAESVDAFLRTGHAARSPAVFHSRIGRLTPEELAAALARSAPAARLAPADPAAGMTEPEARGESARCLRCDCRKPDDCLLRHWATEYKAGAAHYRSEERGRCEVQSDHPGVVLEPGKCIRCGLCIQTAASAGEPLGLAFIGRGCDMRVGVPFGEALAAGLRVSAAACAAACPTGALAAKDEGER